MVWYSHLLNFPQFVVIHTVKGFGIVNKAEVEVFLELSCFFSFTSHTGKGDMGEGKKSPVLKLCLWFSILEQGCFQSPDRWFKLPKPPQLHHLYFWSHVGSSWQEEKIVEIREIPENPGCMVNESLVFAAVSPSTSRQGHGEQGLLCTCQRSEDQLHQPSLGLSPAPCLYLSPHSLPHGSFF